MFSGVFKNVYQWRKAFLLNITAKESDTLRIRPWVVNIVLPYVCHVYNLYIKNQTHWVIMLTVFDYNCVLGWDPHTHLDCPKCPALTMVPWHFLSGHHAD